MTVAGCHRNRERVVWTNLSRWHRIQTPVIVSNFKYKTWGTTVLCLSTCLLTPVTVLLMMFDRDYTTVIQVVRKHQRNTNGGLALFGLIIALKRGSGWELLTPLSH